MAEHMTPPLARVDLHLHSEASNVTDYFAANAFSLPESYSDPVALYWLLRQRRMSLVTLTDHNSIDGIKRLLDAGLPDVFISAEMTATFPEDGCNIHITVANVTERQFAEIDHLRGNVYEMIAWLDCEIAGESLRPGGNRLTYFMTHPLMSTQNRPYGREGSLRAWHIEKALLLCQCIEVRNGSRTRALNELTADMIARLDRDLMEKLADRHGIYPRADNPWLKAVVAGSDDHAGINPGRTWTEFPGATGAIVTPNDLVDAIRSRRTRIAGTHGGPITLAHSVLKLVHEGSRRRIIKAGSAPALSGPVDSLLGLVFDAGSQSLRDRMRFRLKAWYFHATGGGLRRRNSSQPFEEILESEIHAMLGDQDFRARLAAEEATDERIFLVVKTLINRIFERYFQRLRDVSDGNFVGIIKESVALLASNLFVSLPYLVSYLQQGSDCLVARDVRRDFGLATPQRVVLVTDTLFEINGVSATIRRMIHEAIRRNIDFTVVTCLEPGELDRYRDDPEVGAFLAAGRLKVFDSVTTLKFPRYDGLNIHFPPLLDMLRWLQDSGCTKVQVSTPGTIGLAGLFAARMLQIETAATYHTCIPEYVENYTSDITLEALAWKYMIVFYHAVDEVLVPSRYIARLLHERGLRNRKLLILDRWIDTGRFHPRVRDTSYWTKYGDEARESVVRFAYVGRIAVEKDLQLVAQAFRRLHADHPNTRLVLIGDGPYRAEMERLLTGLPVTFTGFLGGDELPQAIASADVKLFPSTTDTWGNAPLEAQACGLPVVVSDVGGPAELMMDGITGHRIPGRDAEALLVAMRDLMDPGRRRRMGEQARRFAEANRVDEPFSAVLDSEAFRRRLAEQKRRTSRQHANYPGSVVELRLPAFDAAELVAASD